LTRLVIAGPMNRFRIDTLFLTIVARVDQGSTT